MQGQRGFTLVELAIVLTIIGLLIGGILKGQELMANARLTATIAQVRSYEAAMTTYMDTYSGLPGDIVGISNRLPGCTAMCEPGAYGGDSRIGYHNWSDVWGDQTQLPAGGSEPGRETTLFWTHLLLADLISGVSPVALTTTQAAWGITHPAARVNGGFTVGYASGVNNLPGGATTTTPPSGFLLVLNSEPSTFLNIFAGIKPLNAKQAGFIDRKMDDGRPSSGYVQAFGYVVSCLTTAGNPVYNESVTAQDCGLTFKIR